MDDQRLQPEESMHAPMPLHYATEPEPVRGRWRYFVVSVVITLPAVVFFIGSIMRDNASRTMLVGCMLYPSLMLMMCRNPSADALRPLFWLVLWLQWPAYGAVLTWAGWHGNRRHMAIAAAVLVAIHLAAAIAAIVACAQLP